MMDLNEIETIEDTKNVNTIIVADVDNNIISSPESAFSLSLRVKDFPSEKHLDKFIKGVEKLVRYSAEYKEWISYILNVLGQNYCAFTEEIIGECSIEIHHHPISLYTICKTLIFDKISKKQDFCSFDIATDAIELHFKNKVGYIPLLNSMHEKYHNGFLKIPINLVHGNHNQLLADYSFEDEDKQHILELCQITTDNCDTNWKKGDYPGIVSNTSTKD